MLQRRFQRPTFPDPLQYNATEKQIADVEARSNLDLHVTLRSADPECPTPLAFQRFAYLSPGRKWPIRGPISTRSSRSTLGNISQFSP